MSFYSDVAPNFNTGIVEIPQVLTALTGSALGLLGADFNNTTNVAQTVRVTDAAGNIIVPDLMIPPHTIVPLEWAMKPLTGLKWSASGSGINGHLWGFQ